MDNEHQFEHRRFVELFDRTHFRTSNWKTVSGAETWFDCVASEEALAGPLYSIYKDGNRTLIEMLYRIENEK